MDSREELIAQIEAAHDVSVYRKEPTYLLGKRIAFAILAPRPDGRRWLLVHPDEMIRREQ